MIESLQVRKHNLQSHTRSWVVSDNRSLSYVYIDLGHHELYWTSINLKLCVCVCCLASLFYIHCILWQQMMKFVSISLTESAHLQKEAFDLIQWIKCIDENRDMDPSTFWNLHVICLYLEQSNVIAEMPLLISLRVLERTAIKWFDSYFLHGEWLGNYCKCWKEE